MPTVAPFAIIRTEKIKDWSSLAKSMGHCLRTSKDTRTHLDADAKESIRVLLGDTNWLDDWKKVVSEMWLPKLKMGTSHTLAREFILTASPEFFDKSSLKEKEEWIEENLSWLKKRFGETRTKFVCAHFDEQTPHISAYIVGLKEDKNRKGLPNTRGNGWTLSDSSIGLGGEKNELEKLQDEYSDAMKKFSLRRGLKGSKATHQSTAKWRKQMSKPIDDPIKIPRIEKPSIQDRINVEAYGKRVSDKSARAIYEQMKPYHQQAKVATAEVKKLREIVKKLEPIAEAFRRLIQKILGTSPRLDTLEGIFEAQNQINNLLNLTKPENKMEIENLIND